MLPVQHFIVIRVLRNGIANTAILMMMLTAVMAVRKMNQNQTNRKNFWWTMLTGRTHMALVTSSPPPVPNLVKVHMVRIGNVLVMGSVRLESTFITLLEKRFDAYNCRSEII